MTLTPRSFRLDLKCGRGAISAGEKCSRGSATQIDQRHSSSTKTKAAVAAVGVAGLATAAFLTRKNWTATANQIWKNATPYSPSSPPPGSKYFSQGNNGQVWVSKDQRSLIKIPKHRKAANQLTGEVAIQSALHDAGIKTPAIYHYDKNKGVVHMEFLNGYKPLAKALKEDTPSIRSAYARSFAYELEKTHTLGYSHGDLNFNNAMVKDGKLSLIDWGFASTVDSKGVQDLSNLVRMTSELDPAYGNVMREEFKAIQNLISNGQKPTKKDLLAFHQNVRRRSMSRVDADLHSTLTPATIRLDLKCGQSAIAQGKTCHKGGAIPRRAALAAGLTAGAVGAALLLRRRSGGPGIKAPSIGAPAASPRGRVPLPTQPRLPGHANPSYPALTGTTPKGLLPPGRTRKSKTQRMRENTAAAVKTAEGRIAQTGREEIRRIAQIGNTMAATGEAAGMATKTTLRELRLRAEAARRRYEPGYRRSPSPTAKAPRSLSGGTSSIQIPFAPARPLTPERVNVDPRTGQPKRRKARGFTGDSAPRQRSDGPSTAYYRAHPKARRHKVRHQAAINSQPDEVDRRVALTRERRRRGIAGKGGPDVSHTSSGGTTLEAPSTNRARNGAGGKARLKADSVWAVGFDADDGKKYTKTVTNPETGRKNRVRYGAQGYRIAPGTPKGNNYCARSFGDMKSHGKDCSGPDRNTPLCLSRAKWRCSGKSSR